LFFGISENLYEYITNNLTIFYTWKLQIQSVVQILQIASPSKILGIQGIQVWQNRWKNATLQEVDDHQTDCVAVEFSISESRKKIVDFNVFVITLGLPHRLSLPTP
jgi:hypothetical protein